MHTDVKRSASGYLIPMSLGELPFIPQRAFVVRNNAQGDERGNHAHRNEEHYLVCVAGSIEIKYEDATGKGSFVLNTGDSHHQKELQWLNLRFLEHTTMLLVFADQEYDENHYIRDYEEFKQLMNKNIT